MMSPERLRAFLHDVQRGYLTRRGYQRFTLLWVRRPARRDQILDAAAAERLGLLTFNGRIGDVTAELTVTGLAVLAALKEA